MYCTSIPRNRHQLQVTSYLQRIMSKLFPLRSNCLGATMVKGTTLPILFAMSFPLGPLMNPQGKKDAGQERPLDLIQQDSEQKALYVPVTQLFQEITAGISQVNSCFGFPPLIMTWHPGAWGSSCVTPSILPANRITCPCSIPNPCQHAGVLRGDSGLTFGTLSHAEKAELAVPLPSPQNDAKNLSAFQTAHIMHAPGRWAVSRQRRRSK